jgi:uncharacterized protein (DUF1499 family)
MLRPRRWRRLVNYIFSFMAITLLVPFAIVYLPGHKSRLEFILRIPHIKVLDFAKLKKISKPNQYLVCPESECEETPDLASRTYPVNATRLAAIWHSTVMAEPDVVELSRDQAALKIEYVQRTNRMRYPDIITVQFLERPHGQSTIAVFSRSIYGYSDRGVNKVRITDWLAKLDKALIS